MITIEQGLQIMRPRIEGRSFHPYYERTVDRKKLYKAMMTGECLSDYLHTFTGREDADQFAIRKEITQECVTPAVNEAAAKFYKTNRYPNIEKDLYYENKTGNIDKLKEALSKFCFEGDVQAYMATEYDRRSLIDPNAFLVIDFGEFDILQNQRAETYGVFIPCENVVDFEYLPNDVLNYLVISQCFSFYDADGVQQNLTDYIGYLGDDILVFAEYHEERKSPSDNATVEEIGTGSYYVYALSPKAGQVQAFRLGYIKDPIANYKTCISPLDAAETVVMDLINDKSEYDQTKRFHVFPQKLQFVDDCPGESQYKTCDRGRTPDGSTCGKCGGSGKVPIHTSSADVLTFSVPKDKDDFYIPLSEMVHYAKPDIEIIQHLREDVEKSQYKILRAIFASESVVKTDGATEIQKTATEFILKDDDLNNILTPFCEQKVKFYKFIVRQVAEFNDLAEKLVIIFKYPESKRIQSVEELQDKLAVMVSQGAPTPLLNAVENEIASKRYIDDPDGLNEYEIINSHRPFRNRKESDVQFAIGAGIVPKWIEVLWANFEVIMEEIIQDETFFDKKYPERAVIVKAAADKLKADLEPAEPTTLLGSSASPQQQ